MFTSLMQPETESICCDLISYFCLISPGDSAETPASSREARMNIITVFIKFPASFLLGFDTLTDYEVLCDN